jgi:hypothetical protein
MRTPTRSTGTRVVAAVVTFFFAFQLSRFFIVASVAPGLCPADSDASLLASGGHHHDENAVSLPKNHDPGYYFQHCKDTVDGLALTPVQPLGLPGATIHFVPDTNWSAAPSAAVSATEHFLPAPFQPPRIQS